MNNPGRFVSGDLPCRVCGKPYLSHPLDPAADRWACVRVDCEGRRFTTGAF